jgi:hypothetical protein
MLLAISSAMLVRDSRTSSANGISIGYVRSVSRRYG